MSNVPGSSSPDYQEAMSKTVPNVPAYLQNQDLAKHVEANDKIGFWKGLALSTGMIGTSAATQMLSVGLALSDPFDAIPDPFSFSLNGLRRAILNMGALTPQGFAQNVNSGYIGAILSEEGLKRYNANNERWKNDAIAQKLTFTPDDEDTIGFGTLGDVTYGEARQAWKDLADGKSNWFLTDWFKSGVDYLTDAGQYMQESFNTGSDTADYIIPQVSNLIGSVAASYLTGRASAGIVGKAGGLKFPAKSGLLTKLNDLNRFESYRKASQAGVTFTQVAGEAVLQAHQTSEEVYDKAFEDTFGEEYKRDIEKSLQDAYSKNQNLGKFGEIRLEREIKDRVQEEWKNKDPELYQKIEEQRYTAYKAVLDMSVINYALNWTSSGLYVRPFHATRELLSSPSKQAAKQIFFEMGQEYLEEGTTAVADLYGKAKASGEQYGAANFIRDFFSPEVQKQALWGMAGGALQTGLVQIADHKQLKKQYDAQQEILKTYDNIVGVKGSEELRKQLYLITDINELQKTMQKAASLEKVGKKAEAEKELSKILHFQAYTAFKNGTTKSLIETYDQLSVNENLTEQERQKAKEAVTTIKTLENIYNDSQKYYNSIDVYDAKAELLQLKSAYKSFVDSKLGQAKRAAIREIATTSQEVISFEDNPQALYDKDTNSPAIKVFQELESKVRDMNEAILEAETRIDQLTSDQAQKDALHLNEYYKKKATYQMLEDKSNKKNGVQKGYKSEKFIEALQKAHKKFTASGNVSKDVLGKMQNDILYEKLLRAQSTKAEQLKESQRIAEENKLKQKDPEVISTPETTPEKQQIAQTIASKVNAASVKQQPVIEEDPDEDIESDFGDDGLLFSPAEISNNLSEEDKNSIADDVAAYVNEMRKGESFPSFKEFISDYIESSSKQEAERFFNVFKEAWDRNNSRNSKFEKANYDQVYNELFSSKADILKRLSEKAEKALATETPEETTKKNEVNNNPPVIVGIEEDANFPVYDHSGTILNFPGSTAAYAAFSVIRRVDNNSVSYERRSDELYPSGYTSPQGIVHPDKFRPGTKVVVEIHPDAENIPVPLHFTEEHLGGAYTGNTMILAEGQKIVTFGDRLKGDVEVLVKVPIGENDIQAPDDVKIVLPKIEFGSQEYWDNVPMIFYEEGKTAQEGSGFIHTPNYYSPLTITKEAFAEAYRETKAIRKLVQTNGKASLTVVHKTTGSISKSQLPEGEYITLEEADPQSMLAIVTGEGTGGVQYVKDGKLVSLADAPLNIIEGTVQFEIGRVFEIRRAGTDDKGNPVYVKLAVNQKNVSESAEINRQIENSIRWAIKIYINQDNPEAGNIKELAEKFKTATGYDLTDMKDLRNYLSLFIKEVSSDSSDTIFTIARKAMEIDSDPGTPYFSTLNGQLHFGIVGQFFGKQDGKDIPMQTIHKGTMVKGSKAAKDSVNNLIDGVLNIPKRFSESKKRRNVSKFGLSTTNKFAFFEADGSVKLSDKTYNEFIRSTFQVNLKSENVGTEENPLYTPYIQPTIGFAISKGQSEVSSKEVLEFKTEGTIKPETVKKVEEKVKEKEPLTPEENDIAVVANVDTTVNELAQNDFGFSEEEAELLRKIEEDLKKSISPEEMYNEDNPLSPKVLDDEALERIRLKVQRIPGLLPHQQDDLVDTIVDHILEKIGLSEDAKISLEETKESVKDFISSKINPIQEAKKKELTLLEGMAIKYPDNPKVTAAIQNIKLLIGKIDIINQNIEILTKEARVILEKDMAIKEVEENVTEEGVSFSKTSLEENAKEQASHQIRRFLRNIKQYDKDGNLVTGFLGFSKSADIDTVFDSLTSLLADTDPDFDSMIAILKNQGAYYPWLYTMTPENATPEQIIEIAENNKHTFVGKLERADQSVKNQFVNLMAKHAMSMKFVMYSVNDNGKYSLRVWDTNSASSIRNIQRDWNTNFMEKMTLVNEQGEYYLDVERAKEVLAEVKEYFQKTPNNVALPKNVSEILYKAVNEKVNRAKLMGKETIEVVLTKEEAEAIKGTISTRLKTIGAKGQTMSKSYIIQNLGNGKVTIKAVAPVTYDPVRLRNFLANVGITVHLETIQDLMKNGMTVKVAGKKKPKFVKLEQMFHVSSETEGIFGLIAYKLQQAIIKHNEGEQTTFGVGNDVNLNDTIIRKLAAKESKFGSAKPVTSWRDNGKTIYGFTPSKFVTDRVNELKKFLVDPVNNEELINETLEELKKVGFSKESFLIKLLEDEPGFLDKFQASHLGITALKEINKNVYRDNDITHLSDDDHELTKKGAFEDTTQGELKPYKIKVNGIEREIPMRVASMFGLTMSDKTGMFLFQTGVFDFKKKFFKTENDRVTGLNQEILELMYQQTVLPELNRMFEYAKNKYNHDNYNGSLFYFITGLNNIEITEGVSIYQHIVNNPEMTLKELENTIKDKMLEEVEATVKELVSEKLEVWTKAGFITKGEEDKTVLKYFDNRYLDSLQTSNADLQADLAAYNYVMNYLIHNVNMFALFAGDPAQYYKKAKSGIALDSVRETFSNINKRMALLNAPGNKLADSTNAEYLQIFLEDNEGYAKDYDKLVAQLGEEFAAAYKKTNETDAQEYTTWQEHLYVLEKLGKTPDIILDIKPEEIEEARKIFSNEKYTLENLTDKQKALIKKVMQPIKPVYTGSDYDQQMNIMRTVYIKSSAFPLIPQLTKGLEIDNLRVLIERVQEENPDKLNVRAVYHSGAKVGSVAEEMNIFGDTGLKYMNGDSPKSLRDIPVQQIIDKHTLRLKRKNFRIQQDVPYKAGKREEDTTSMGTQMSKILLGGKVITLNGFDYKGAFDGFNFIQTTEKQNGLSIYDSYFKLHDLLIQEKKKELYDELGLNSNGVPKNIAYSAKVLQEILEKEAINRNYSKQDIDALGLNKKKEFNIPIWLLSNSDRIESLLMSIVQKRMAKIKFPGNSYVVGSEAGFKMAEMNHLSASEKEGIIWVNEEARAGLKGNQILVPSRFRNKDGKLINLIEEGYAILKEENGRRFYTLDKTKVSDELLTLIDFRIPTSAHNSLSADEIAGFLPETVGDLMIVSKNKTIQKGLDFDVDKENSYQQWHTINDQGKIFSISEIYSLETLDKEIADLLEKNEEFFEDIKDLKEVDDEKSVAFLEGEIKENKERLKELRKAKSKLLQNEIVKIHKAILQHEDMQSEISKVLSIDIAKAESNFIQELRTDNSGKFIAISDEYQKKQMALGSSGKLGIGAYSLDVVGHSVFTQMNAIGEPLGVNLLTDGDNDTTVPYAIQFGGFTSSMTLGQVKTLDGKRNIADILSERQNIATDNVKAEVMGKANLNSYTLDVDKAMIMLGFDFGEDGHSIPFLFLSQPIIIDYVEEMKKAESNIAGYIPDKKAYVISKLIQKYGGETMFYPNENSIQEFGASCTNQAMIEQIKGNVDNYFQQAVLDRFLTLDRVGRNIRYIQTTINVDSKGLGVSFFDVIDRIDKVESLLEDMKLITNADKLIGEFKTTNDAPVSDLLAAGFLPLKKYYVKPTTVVGSFTVRTLSAANQLWSKYYPYQSRTVNQIFDEINSAMFGSEEQDLVDRKKIGSEEKQKVFKEIKKFIYSSAELGLFSEDVQAERERLFFDRVEGKKVKQVSLATYARNLLNMPSMPDAIRNNKFLRTLEFIPQKNGNISMIRFNNAAMESFNEEAIYRSLIDLLTSKVQLPDFNGKPYKSYDLISDLIAYAYLEGGIQEASQFIKFVPVSYLQEMPFASQLRKLHNFLIEDNERGFFESNFFGLDYNRAADPDKFKYNFSTAALQYVQHHPHKIKKIAPDLIENPVFYKNNFLSELMEFNLRDSNPLPFLTIYNEDAKGAKFQLYKYDPSTKSYKRIPTYGTFGMSEYNQNANKSLTYPSLIQKEKTSMVIEKGDEIAPDPVVSPNIGLSSLFTEKESVISSSVLDRVASMFGQDPNAQYYSELLKIFKEAINTVDIKIVIGDIKDREGNKVEGKAAYDRNTSTIIIDKDFAKSATIPDMNQVFMHELVHGMTIQSLKPYLGAGKLENLSNIDFTNAPPHVIRIVNVFKEARTMLLNKYGTELSSMNPKIGLTAKQRAIYGGYDVYEFIAEVLSNKQFVEELKEPYKGRVKSLYQRFVDFVKSAIQSLGIDIPKGSLAEQAIITSLEIVTSNQIVSDTVDIRKKLESVRPGDKITINYTSASTPDDNVTRTITIHDINDNYIIGFDNYRGEVREFRRDRIHNLLNVEKGKGENPYINIWYGTGEHSILSNIAYKPFVFNGVSYISVEHAYQSLRSGEFDKETYEKYLSEHERIAREIAEELTLEQREILQENANNKLRKTQDDVYQRATEIINEAFSSIRLPDNYSIVANPDASGISLMVDEKIATKEQVSAFSKTETFTRMKEIHEEKVRALFNQLEEEYNQAEQEYSATIKKLESGFNGIAFKKKNAIEEIYGDTEEFATIYGDEEIKAPTEEALIEKISLRAFREAKPFRLPKIYGNKGEYTLNNAHLSLMESLMAESFKQNPEAVKTLLETGGAILTHSQASDNWKTDFPEILMKLRANFKVESNTIPSVSQVVEIDQYKITIDTNGRMTFKNGSEVTDQTIINKVRLKINTDPNRIINYNKFDYYVFEDGTIVNYETGKTVYKENTPDRANIMALLDKKLNPVPETAEDKIILEKADSVISKIENVVQSAILKMRSVMINYTEGQKQALEKISRFIDTQTDESDYFLLAGYAGTGKTTIIENIVKYAQKTGKKAVILAPTNKAAFIAKTKLQASNTEVEATTIHRMMYGEPDEHGNWIPKELEPNTVYIVDESSMMSQSVLDDMMELAEEVQSKVIFVGDSFQLEPVESDPKLFAWNNRKFKKDNKHELTEVKRQNKGTILTLATALRTLKGKAFMPNKSEDDFRIVDDNKFNALITESFVKGEDAVVVTSTNPKRVSYNHLVRKGLFGAEAKNVVNKKEKMIITASNERLNNGEIVVVDDYQIMDSFDLTFIVRKKPEKIPFYLMIVDITNPMSKKKETHHILFSPDLPVSSFSTQELLKKAREEYKVHHVDQYIIQTKSGEAKIKNLLTATYGYSVTAHKSQGSEWSKVFLDATWLHEDWNKARWFYTAITRAKNSIITQPSRFLSAKPMNEIENIAFPTVTKEDIDNSEDFINLSPTGSIFEISSDAEIQEISSTFVDANNKPIC